MRRLLLVTLLVCLPVAASGVHAADPDRDRPSIGTAANITVDPVLTAVVDDMLAASPAFRQQWKLLAGMRRVRIRILLQSPEAAPRAVRAHCQMSRYEYGQIEATVKIVSKAQAPELIAHELEHVMEFAEGINYQAMSVFQRGAAWLTREGHYETRRAIEAGELVSREIWRARGSRAAKVLTENQD